MKQLKSGYILRHDTDETTNEYFRSANGVVVVYEYRNDYYAAQCFLDDGRVCRSSFTVSASSRRELMRDMPQSWGVVPTPIDAIRAKAILTLETSDD